MRKVYHVVGSIPAYAGEASCSIRAPRISGVDPRVCGGGCPNILIIKE